MRAYQRHVSGAGSAAAESERPCQAAQAVCGSWRRPLKRVFCRMQAAPSRRPSQPARPSRPSLLRPLGAPQLWMSCRPAYVRTPALLHCNRTSHVHWCLKLSSLPSGRDVALPWEATDATLSASMHLLWRALVGYACVVA